MEVNITLLGLIEEWVNDSCLALNEEAIFDEMMMRSALY
jgi:hypothetical protein